MIRRTSYIFDEFREMYATLMDVNSPGHFTSHIVLSVSASWAKEAMGHVTFDHPHETTLLIGIGGDPKP